MKIQIPLSIKKRVSKEKVEKMYYRESKNSLYFLIWKYKEGHTRNLSEKKILVKIIDIKFQKNLFERKV